MAEALLSTFLKALFDKMVSPKFVDFFRQRKLNEGIFKKLKIVLLSAYKLRKYAEDKQLTDRSVRDWLYMLKDALYDVEDVLGEIAIEALQHKLDAEFQTTTSKVRFLEVLKTNLHSKIHNGGKVSCLEEGWN